MAVAKHGRIDVGRNRQWQGWAARIALLISALLSLLTGMGQARASVANPDALAQAVLHVHNQLRSAANVPPVRWNNELARRAADWAQHLAGLGYMIHSTGGGGSGQGENIWMGSAGAFSYEVMVSDWASEARYFKRGVFPDVSTTGDWQDTGHFTQMIWRDTREVGCAVATSHGWDFLVCRYDTAGNVYGKTPL